MIAITAFSQQDLDNATQNNMAAKAQLQAARAQVETATAQIAAAAAGVQSAKADVVKNVPSEIGDISGYYSCKGVEAGGKAYSGIAVIMKKNDVYETSRLFHP